MENINLEGINFTEVYAKLTKKWLSPNDLEAEYGFSKSTQAKMRMASSNSKIPYHKIGSKYIRYSREDIDVWIENHKVIGV